MSIAECAAIVERGDPDRFLATMAAPVSAREILFPLYAFNVEVTRAPWVSQEVMICEMRLQWWHDVLGEISDGKAPRAHEVVAPLADAIRAKGALVDPLQALITSRRRDMSTDPFEDEAAFSSYLNETAGGLMWVAACALGAPAQAEEAVRGYGWASGLARYFQAVPELEARGRRPLADGRAEAVVALAREGSKRLSRMGQVALPRSARPALLAGWRAQGMLRRAAAAPELVAAGALGESEFTRRAALLRRSVWPGW